MTKIGYVALGFCTLAGMVGGYAGFDFVATKTGLKTDVARIKARKNAEFYEFEDDDDDEDDDSDVMVQMAAQNRAEAGDPIQ